MGTICPGRVTPYLVYLDHAHADIVLALRGFNLGRESDYALLLDNRLGKRCFDGGYVHNGLLRAAGWVLDRECDLLRDLLDRYPAYTLTFTGHSLGAGVAAMLTMVVVLNLDKLGKVERGRTRCYAMAPARCMSLNLAVRYADVINSVVLQVTSSVVEEFGLHVVCLNLGYM
uniref:Fungal lipase-type domain-containing protein n=1 Tax=Aegilops tauschii subsp. strangulata TaxID=200361 RepID=A0A453QL63_AEGTS